MSDMLRIGAEDLTVEEADRLYPNDKIEVIDGVVHMMAPPSVRHQKLLSRISGRFEAFFNGKACQPYLEIGVRLNRHRRVIPDLVVVCDREKMDDAGCNGAPDLVVEVLSPSNSDYDIGEKKALYQSHGVREYWVLDPDRGTGIRWVWDTGKLEAGENKVSIVKDKIESVIFPGLVVDII
jgi:Uma2 family endonuclease